MQRRLGGGLPAQLTTGDPEAEGSQKLRGRIVKASRVLHGPAFLRRCTAATRSLTQVLSQLGAMRFVALAPAPACAHFDERAALSRDR